MKKKVKSTKKPVCYAFIDAANLFYGGQKSLGWSIDYKKFLEYLKEKYSIRKAFYYAGVEINKFSYDALSSQSIDINKLLRFHCKKLKEVNISKVKTTLLEKHIQRIKFYRKLEKFGYILRLKPTKIYRDGNRTVKKANCDVDMTFDLMRYISQYEGLVVLSGDGDFAIVLSYLKRKSKKLHILARGERTAREIRQLAGSRFMDFNYLRERIKFEKK